MRSFWDDMKRMHNEMDRLFDDFFSVGHPTNLLPGEMPISNVGSPATDYWETDKEVRMELDLPGIDKGDVEINATGDSLEIKAQKKHESKEEKKGFRRIERACQSFYRKLPLPEYADTENIDAKLENGVLKISMPKKQLEAPKAKQIEVK